MVGGCVGFQVPGQGSSSGRSRAEDSPLVPGLATVMMGQEFGRLIEARPATVGTGAGRLAAGAYVEGTGPAHGGSARRWSRRRSNVACILLADT